MHSQTVCGEEHVHGPQCDTQLHILSWQENGVVECVLGRVARCYCSSVGQERKECLAIGHITVDGRDVQWKNQYINLFNLGDSGAY